MRLFHVSEEPDIAVFHPRPPVRADLDPTVGLVWAIDEARLPNFLTPRDCPRVTYHVGEAATAADREAFFMDRQDGQYSIAPLRYVEQEYRPYKLTGAEKKALGGN